MKLSKLQENPDRQQIRKIPHEHEQNKKFNIDRNYTLKKRTPKRNIGAN